MWARLVQSIQEFHYPALVVCCRQEEFDRAGEILHGLQGAVYLEPFQDQQICDYLKSMDRSPLWEKIQTPELRELLPDWDSCQQAHQLLG